MKIFKKFLALTLVMCCVLSMAGCGVSMEKAEWEGYTGMPFVEYLQKGIEGEWDYDPEVVVTVTCEEGWNDSEELLPSQASKGSKPVTYEVKIEQGDFYNITYIFAELDKTLVVRGSKSIESDDDDVLNMSASETCEMLNDLRDYIY